jgi:integrase
MTGCRLGEIMRLRWDHVDIPGKALRVPDSKTGAKVVHLGQPAIEVLENIERIENNPWVVLGAVPGGRLSDLQAFWQRVRARAGLKYGSRYLDQISIGSTRGPRFSATKVSATPTKVSARP